MVISAIHRITSERHAFQIAVLLAWIGAIYYFTSPIVDEYKFVTLHQTLKAGEITVITRNTAHCYYLYRDQSMGFEYDLAKAFADYLGVRLKVKIIDKWEDMVPALKDGTGAFIAASVTITPKRQNQVAFSEGYMQIQQHIITHKAKVKIEKAKDLAGLTIHVRKGTSYHERIEDFQRKGIDIKLELHDDLFTEELIQRVADKKIEFTVANSNIALINRHLYPGADIAGPIGDKQYLGWVVYPKSHQLLKSINDFFRTIKENGKFGEIYNKYYGDVQEFDFVDLKIFHRRIKTRLSRFSPFIKAAAKNHGFDWRLIAAQMYQESHLNPWAKSKAGARGLMQLMPRTARSLGVNDIFDPVQNINAGVQHLKNLYDRFSNAQGQDRLLISLAAYNIGQGHISDARKLAARMKLDPNRWDSLAKTLPLLRYRKYYVKAKHGFCQGTEPLKYIKQILVYYDILKRQGIEFSATQASFQQEKAQ